MLHPKKLQEKCERKGKEKERENKEKGLGQKVFPSFCIQHDLSFKQRKKIEIVVNFKDCLFYLFPCFLFSYKFGVGRRIKIKGRESMGHKWG